MFFWVFENNTTKKERGSLVALLGFFGLHDISIQVYELRHHLEPSRPTFHNTSPVPPRLVSFFHIIWYRISRQLGRNRARPGTSRDHTERHGRTRGGENRDPRTEFQSRSQVLGRNDLCVNVKIDVAIGAIVQRYGCRNVARMVQRGCLAFDDFHGSDTRSDPHGYVAASLYGYLSQSDVPKVELTVLALDNVDRNRCRRGLECRWFLALYFLKDASRRARL